MLAEGLLFDCTAFAYEMGLAYRVDLSLVAWAQCVPSWTTSVDRQARTRAVLGALRVALDRADGAPVFHFQVRCNVWHSEPPSTVRLVAIIDRGKDPAMTVVTASEVGFERDDSE
ncbi:hypothetical protein LZC95_07810 [Pendulispora brunnea]|uniref:Uncharacterized protein n=1 Tax=Pendulispora brunnea TaxID=2905690 RepID=A0ABZ2KI51_9BACT